MIKEWHIISIASIEVLVLLIVCGEGPLVAFPVAIFGWLGMKLIGDWFA